MKNAIAKQTEINQELTTLIDEDLKQEQELLKSLIKEILEANEKIKNAHFERVQDTEEKLKVLNAEVRRIRRTIKKQDDTVTKKRLELLAETKKEYFETLADMRLIHAKEHFANPLRKHLADLKRSFSQAFKETPVEIHSVETTINSYFNALDNLLEKDQEVSQLTLDESHQQWVITSDGIQETLEALTPFANHVFQTFKSKLDTLLSFFDTSELDDLVDDIQLTKTDDIESLNDSKKALDEALADEIDKLNADYLTEWDGQLQETFDASQISLSETEQTTLDSLKSLKADYIQRRLRTPEHRTAKRALKKALRPWHKSPAGKACKKVDRQFMRSLKAIDKEKHQKEAEHLEQSYEIRMQQKEREIQALIDISSLKMRTLLTYLENQEETLLSTFASMEEILHRGYELEMALVQLEKTIQTARLQTQKRDQELRLQKADLLKRYERIIARLEVASLSDLEKQQTHFKVTEIDLQTTLERERLEINRLFGLHKILSKRVNFLGKAKVKRMDELKDLKFDLYQQEADIALAEKEYDIQVLKAQSLHDHEKAINKVQSERIDAGVRVNKAMVQATVKRQVNFAEQQIKFAEAEYAARMEHIDYTLKQELSYAEETLGYHEKNYAAKKAEMEQEYESQKHSIAQKKKLFEHSPILKKVLMEEKEIDEAYAERQAAFEAQLTEDINIKRYRTQIQKAQDYAEKARQDALNLRDKDIESFSALKEESLARLANVEKMMAGPELLAYQDGNPNDQANERLQAMLKTAEDFLNEKIAEPKARLETIKPRILELEKGDVNAATVQELSRQEQNLNEAHRERLQALMKSASQKKDLQYAHFEEANRQSVAIMAAIDRELEAPLETDKASHETLQTAIERHEKALESTLEQWRSEHLMKKNERLNALNRTQNAIKNRLIDTSVKTRMKVEKIENLQNKAISESYAALHKQFKKDKKALK